MNDNKVSVARMSLNNCYRLRKVWLEAQQSAPAHRLVVGNMPCLVSWDENCY
jgi:hypothetical protein